MKAKCPEHTGSKPPRVDRILVVGDDDTLLSAEISGGSDVLQNVAELAVEVPIHHHVTQLNSPHQTNATSPLPSKLSNEDIAMVC